jgi:hypothetical protein
MSSLHSFIVKIYLVCSTQLGQEQRKFEKQN